MTGVVLDASAVLAIVNGEAGAAEVATRLVDARISAINYGEVTSHLVRKQLSSETIERTLRPLRLTIVPANAEHARIAGELVTATRAAGLSLGDRFCLALARTLALPALTADRQWAFVSEAVGVEVVLIR